MATEINRALLRTLRTEIDTALKSIGQKHGLALQLEPRGSFTETELHLKVLGMAGSGGASAVQAKREADWNQYAKSLGLDPAWLHQHITFSGDTYEIMGLVPSRHKYPVAALKNGSRPILLTIESVLRNIERPATKVARRAR